MSVSSLLSPTAQATLLLTSYFSQVGNEAVKPLTNSEWGRFALWLKEKSITPADLLAPDPQFLLKDWHDARISTERIIELLTRGNSLAFAMEKWQRAGLWVVTRSDSEYPWRLKQRLKTGSPPVLFGCGNKALLNAGGLAVVGSRHANESDLAFTDEIGALAASEGVAIVSGGARGVDETAMLSAITQGGVVIGVMADSLLKAATSSKWRKGLMGGNTVLVSPFHPEAGFNAGNAMARNKYIYCLADASLVIHSGKKGGTLNGAEENLRKAWVPLWVKPTTDKDAANADLVFKGGRWLEGGLQGMVIAHLVKPGVDAVQQVIENQNNFFSKADQPALFAEMGMGVAGVVRDSGCAGEQAEVEATSEQLFKAEAVSSCPTDFYRLFITELWKLAMEPVSVDELMESTGLHKLQLNDWLKRAENDGVVKRMNRPVRYQIKSK